MWLDFGLCGSCWWGWGAARACGQRLTTVNTQRHETMFVKMATVVVVVLVVVMGVHVCDTWLSCALPIWF